MAKQHVLVSPFGPLTLRVFPEHLRLEAPDQLAADWGLGWWHAHDAGDEAVFCRTFWRGELGAQPRSSLGGTEVDAFVSYWEFDSRLAEETNSLSAGHRARVHAYTQGFNQGRKKRGKEKPWTPEDCHLLARTLGFLEWWETRAPQAEFLLKAWQAGLPWAQILDLWPGLGPEPNKEHWKGITFPKPFSPEARGFVDRVRRFRPGSVCVVPGTGGKSLLAASYVSDVTDQGLPFLPVRIELPSGKTRGLTRPGHPGFLSGRTATLAWHVTPAVDDSIDLRILERDKGRTLAGVWAGSRKTGTLEGLLSLESATTVEYARERTSGLAAACLNFAAVDAAGGGARWSQGARWVRPSARDAWLPTSWASEVPAGPRQAVFDAPPLTRATTASLEAFLAQTKSDLPERALATLRFLLPDTEEGRRLRRWTGTPDPETEASFERLYDRVLTAFWQTSPVVPGTGTALAQTLAPLVDRIIQAPHSAWFPSQDKNRRLAEAVRFAFAPGAPPGQPLLRRQAPLSLWTEMLGDRPHIFAATTAVVVDLSEPGWRVFLTDDETEECRFHVW